MSIVSDILFFTSPIGLGHATRDYAISSYLQNSIKFITGGGAALLFSRYGLDVLDAYDPPKFMVKNGMLENATNWLWKYYKFYKQCKTIAEKIIQNENPRIIVSDEDFASLVVGQKKKIPTILITDILQTRFTSGFSSIIEKIMNRSMRKIISKCDYVIVPCHGIDSKKIKYVGPIVRKITQSREELREKFGFSKNTVLISVGGTSAGRYLIKRALEATSNLNVQRAVVSGPSIQEKYTDVKNFGFVENLHELIYAADVVISLAGKSTIDECKAYGTPGIFIPIKNHFEQENNAKEQGYYFDDINRLDTLVTQKLAQKRILATTNGAEKSAQIICDVFSKI